MIDLKDKSFKNLLSEMLGRVPDTYDKRDTSPIQTALAPAAYVLEGFYLTLNQVQQSAFIQTAVGESLDYLAVLGGITRYQASHAVRLGVFNLSVPIGTRFSTIAGSNSINFRVTAQHGEFQYQLTAETPGKIGNEYSGPILPIDTVPGLTSAQITDILIPGDDTETDEQLRERLILALNQRPFGGNIADYRSNISAIDGVGGVQVYPTWQGGGTVKCSIVGADFMPASPELVETVQNAIDPPPNQGLGLGLAPIGAKVTISAPERVSIDISATVSLASGYSIGQIQPLVEEKLETYMESIRKNWSDPISQSTVSYAAPIYRAQIIAAMIGVTGIINASNVLINGEDKDLMLEQSGELQQLPVLGGVTLNESS